MGSGSSSEITTHAELYNRTRGTRRMVDDIFTYMMHHVKINDFMKLSNPESCHHYALFMANNLNLFFSKLSVRPELGKDGIMAFRRIDDLEEPKGPAKQEKESLCLVLAYFYTRIFQMYGAMALTLLDDIRYTVDATSLIAAPAATETESSVALPGEKFTYVEPRTPKTLRTEQYGGWVRNLGYFDFLNARGVLVERDVSSMDRAISFGYPTSQPATERATSFGYTVDYQFNKEKENIMYFNP